MNIKEWCSVNSFPNILGVLVHTLSTFISAKNDQYDTSTIGYQCFANELFGFIQENSRDYGLPIFISLVQGVKIKC